ncbi:MAG: hypothetical protein KIS81_11600 [Maricaulaceae bacterium]|nr:hypothetical protein [Maricaulaceae bacterium]
MFGKRSRKTSPVPPAAAPAGDAKTRSAEVQREMQARLAGMDQALLDRDAAAQRLINRAALKEMGDYGPVILASDSLRPAWGEAGDLSHVRRGAEDAAGIAKAVAGETPGAADAPRRRRR